MNEPAPQEREPLSMSALRRDLAAELFSLERGLAHTFIQVWRAPAATAVRYVRNRDATLVRPVRYLLIAVAGYSALAWLLLSRLGLAERLAFTPAQSAQSGFIIQHAGWIVLIVVPAIALLLRALQPPRSGSYVEALVLVAYTQAQSLWYQALVLAPLAFLATPWPSTAATVSVMAWLLWAWSGYFPGRIVRGWLAAALALLAGTALNQGIVYLALRWFGPG